MVVVPFLNSLDNPFVWDDSNAIVNNPTIRSLWPLWAPLQPPAETPVSTRPLVNLSFAMNYAVHGLDVRGYHLVNLGLHLLTACLLFATLRRALATGMPFFDDRDFFKRAQIAANDLVLAGVASFADVDRLTLPDVGAFEDADPVFVEGHVARLGH